MVEFYTTVCVTGRRPGVRPTAAAESPGPSRASVRDLATGIAAPIAPRSNYRVLFIERRLLYR